MRIHGFYGENFMRLKAAQFHPTGNVFTISGKNGSGKSSILKAIFAALGGKGALPDDPVRHGEERARIQLDLGELIVTLKITPDAETTLTVTAADGARYPSPQKMLDSLRGALTFDPLQFSRMKPKEQRDTLAQLVGLDAMLRDLAVSHQVDFDNRTVINRSLKASEARLNAMPIEAPAVAVDVQAVMAELREAEAHNRRVETMERELEAKEGHSAQLGQQASEWRAQADELLQRAARAISQAEQLDAEVAAGVAGLPEPIVTAVLHQQIEDAQAINDRVRRNVAREELAGEVSVLRDQSNELTQRMESREQEKAAVIGAAAFPIPGLGLTDDGVTLQGVPFDQASQAEKIRTSAAIGFALNPKLRIMCIEDASLLDDDSLAELEALAEAKDFQVLLERVGEVKGVGIVMREGEIVDDATPIAAAPSRRSRKPAAA